MFLERKEKSWSDWRSFCAFLVLQQIYALKKLVKIKEVKLSIAEWVVLFLINALQLLLTTTGIYIVPLVHVAPFRRHTITDPLLWERNTRFGKENQQRWRSRLEATKGERQNYAIISFRALIRLVPGCRMCLGKSVAWVETWSREKGHHFLVGGGGSTHRV